MESDPQPPLSVSEERGPAWSEHRGSLRENDGMVKWFGARTRWTLAHRHADGVVGAVPVVGRIEEVIMPGPRQHSGTLDHPRFPPLAGLQQCRRCLAHEGGAVGTELL